jgi:hypothetical protein
MLLSSAISVPLPLAGEAAVPLDRLQPLVGSSLGPPEDVEKAKASRKARLRRTMMRAMMVTLDDAAV